jgi:hypothetical protein
MLGHPTCLAYQLAHPPAITMDNPNYYLLTLVFLTFACITTMLVVYGTHCTPYHPWKVKSHSAFILNSYSLFIKGLFYCPRALGCVINIYCKKRNTGFNGGEERIVNWSIKLICLTVSLYCYVLFVRLLSRCSVFCTTSLHMYSHLRFISHWLCN